MNTDFAKSLKENKSQGSKQRLSLYLEAGREEASNVITEAHDGPTK